MRAFVFIAAGTRYAIEASWVEAVHPLVRARPVHGAPSWLAGVIDVHGELVPLVDASALLAGDARTVPTLGARVLLIDAGVGGDGPRARFALSVDRVDAAADLDADGSWRTGAQAVPWLGAVLQHRGQPVQMFDPGTLASGHPQLAAPAGPIAPRERSR